MMVQSLEFVQKDRDLLTARVKELEETNTVLMTRNSELFNRCVEKQKEITASELVAACRVAELEKENKRLNLPPDDYEKMCFIQSSKTNDELRTELAAAKEEMDSWYRKCGLAELELAAAKAEIERLKSKTVFVPMHEKGTDDGPHYEEFKRTRKNPGGN
jgi:hypothetical protein